MSENMSRVSRYRRVLTPEVSQAIIKRMVTVRFPSAGQMEFCPFSKSMIVTLSHL
jgi:hypothetical protein